MILLYSVAIFDGVGSPSPLLIIVCVIFIIVEIVEIRRTFLSFKFDKRINLISKLSEKN